MRRGLPDRRRSLLSGSISRPLRCVAAAVRMVRGCGSESRFHSRVTHPSSELGVARRAGTVTHNGRTDGRTRDRKPTVPGPDEPTKKAPSDHGFRRPSRPRNLRPGLGPSEPAPERERASTDVRTRRFEYLILKFGG